MSRLVPTGPLSYAYISNRCVFLHLNPETSHSPSNTMPSNAPRGASTRAVDEESPLIGRVATKSESSRLVKHLQEDVSRGWADAVLLFGYISTGLLDSSAVYIWGSFVSMQTG